MTFAYFSNGLGKNHQPDIFAVSGKYEQLNLVAFLFEPPLWEFLERTAKDTKEFVGGRLTHLPPKKKLIDNHAKKREHGLLK